MKPGGDVEERERQTIVGGFRLSSLAEEFKKHSYARIDRLRNSRSDFDEGLYEEAVELVLRKISGRESENPR